MGMYNCLVLWCSCNIVQIPLHVALSLTVTNQGVSYIVVYSIEAEERVASSLFPKWALYLCSTRYIGPRSTQQSQDKEAINSKSSMQRYSVGLFCKGPNLKFNSLGLAYTRYNCTMVLISYYKHPCGFLSLAAMLKRSEDVLSLASYLPRDLYTLEHPALPVHIQLFVHCNNS